MKAYQGGSECVCYQLLGNKYRERAICRGGGTLVFDLNAYVYIGQRLLGVGIDKVACEMHLSECTNRASQKQK